MAKTTNYESVVEIARTESEAKDNEYLKLGWVLLNVESHQYSEHGWVTAYVFGWNKDIGEIKHPEPSEWEKMMEEAEDESIPF